ncbi:MAG: hypothetical protein ACTSW7_01480 [Candidatus Thorarchaeota archaeon]|nr:hypothetical protein [Thermoplasmatales archaeon]
MINKKFAEKVILTDKKTTIELSFNEKVFTLITPQEISLEYLSQTNETINHLFQRMKNRIEHEKQSQETK